MQTLLRIDASIRKTGSYSRATGDYFQAQWTLKHPTGKIIYRDLADSAIPHVHHQLTNAFFDTQQASLEILSLSNLLLDELKQCNTLLITSALYNFSLPSSLKSWFDHIVRVNQTFCYSEDGRYTGLLQDKEAVIITSKGSVYKGTGLEHLDFQDPYLKAILYFMGIKTIASFSVEGTKNPDFLKESLPGVEAEIFNFLHN